MAVPSLKAFFVLFITILVWFYANSLGKKHSLEHYVAGCKPHSVGISTNQVIDSVSDQCDDDADETTISESSRRIYLHKISGTTKGGTLEGLFSMLHHPGMPVKTEIVYTKLPSLSDEPNDKPYDNCRHMYLTRTGALVRMSNKCLAIAMLDDNYIPNPYIQSHRIGVVANNTNMYQPDYVDSFALDAERELLPLFIRNINDLTIQLIHKMGPPVDENGNRKTLTILVANEGVVDLVLNFICSCKEAKIDTSNIVVFLGSPDIAPLIESMGVQTFFHEALGPIPKKAASNYGDLTFGILMWLKTTSIYIASNAGYDILFQDADLVWISDPLPYLKESIHDIAFMDDGARTPRFTPFFVNSGFYYQKHNPRTLYLMEKMMKAICEISMTHSHQTTLTRHITEAHHLMDLQIVVLNQRDFPSGMVYHHDKKFIAEIKSYAYTPKVFHMCWTQSREEKVTYFQDIGMWFLPVSKPDTEGLSASEGGKDKSSFQVCNDPKQMLEWVLRQNSVDSGSRQTIVDKCCEIGDYWASKPL